MRIRLLSSMGALALILSMAAPGFAQELLKIERSKVLASVDKIVPYSKQISISKGKGRVADEPLRNDTGKTWRVHFRVGGVSQPQTWTLRVVDDTPQRSRLWESPPLEEDETDLWSDEFSVSAVRIEVHSTQENNPLQLSIDRIVEDGPRVYPQAITSPDNREPINNQDPETRRFGKSVARIRFISDEDGLPYVCTGFLVSSDIIMTNHHCIKTPREARSSYVDFDYNSPGPIPVTIRGKELLLSDRVLDFALFKLRATLDTGARVPMKLEASKPRPNQALLLIEHAAGQPKEVSILDCRINAPGIAGLSEALTDFEHLCDTLGGSSGSPLQDINSGNVIGIHHLGFLTNDPNPDKPKLCNRAVRMEEILKFIRAQKPELIPKLSIQ